MVLLACKRMGTRLLLLLLVLPGCIATWRREEAQSRLLHEHYPSQRDRPWYDREAFFGLARIRGIECKARYAEAFHVNKLVLDLAGG